MEGAAQYLKKELSELLRRYQQLRHEEIELITLNTFGHAWEVKNDG